MVIKQTVKVTNRGMVSIPAAIRKKYKIKDGDRILFIEEEDGLKLHIIKTLEELQKNSYTTEEMIKLMEKTHKEDLEMEF